jgi:hypothetical protein
MPSMMRTSWVGIEYLLPHLPANITSWIVHHVKDGVPTVFGGYDTPTQMLAALKKRSDEFPVNTCMFVTVYARNIRLVAKCELFKNGFGQLVMRIISMPSCQNKPQWNWRRYGF